MSDFKAKIHQIRFPLGFRPRPRWGSAPNPAGGAYSAPPDPLAVFKGPTSKGREGKGGKEGKGKGGESGVRRAPISCWHRAPEGLIRHWRGDEKGRGGKGRDHTPSRPPQSIILDTPLNVSVNQL